MRQQQESRTTHENETKNKRTIQRMTRIGMQGQRWKRLQAFDNLAEVAENMKVNRASVSERLVLLPEDPFSPEDLLTSQFRIARTGQEPYQECGNGNAK